MEGSFETVYCIHCKAPIAPNVMTCPKCGGSQMPGSPPPSAGAPPKAKRRELRWEKGRPAGVTVIAGIIIVLSILNIMISCALASLLELAAKEVEGPEVQAARAIFAYVIPLFSLFNIAVAIGLLYMKPWARIVAIIVNLLAAGLNGLSLVGAQPSLFYALTVIFLLFHVFVVIYLLPMGPDFADYVD